MSNNRIFALGIACAASFVLLVSSARSQCVSLGGGCLGSQPPACSNPPIGGGPLTIFCPTAMPCSTPPVMFIGSCIFPPVGLLPPLACGACSFGVNPWATVGPVLTVSLPPFPGFKFCVQCGCINTNADGLTCVNLSELLSITII